MENKNTLIDSIIFYLRRKNFKDGIVPYNKLLKPEIYLYTKENGKITERMLPIYKYYEHLWDNEDLKDKNLFIFDYFCGSGDVIMFSRYIPFFTKHAKKVIVELHNNFVDIYKYNFPECKIIEKQNKEYEGHYDYTYHHELFLNLQKDLDNFPYPEGYLKVNPRLLQKFAPLFSNTKKNVGIFFESKSRINKNRNIPLEFIIPILENANCRFYALTKEAPDSKTKEFYKAYNIIALSNYIKNMHDTAAMMKNMDLVVSIDSFPIHLAGALGVKAFLMLPFESDWRWFNDYDTTPWYNSVRIFKQNCEGDWKSVIDSVSRELKKL